MVLPNLGTTANHGDRENVWVLAFLWVGLALVATRSPDLLHREAGLAFTCD
jgi:hypothetical protein